MDNKKSSNGTRHCAESFWQKKSKYGIGTHGLLLNCQIFDPDFLDGRFTWNELGYLLTLSFICVKYDDWRILATEPFLKEAFANRGMGSSGSLKRFKSKWIGAGFMERVRYGGLSGNEYIVGSLLIAKHKAETMAHYEESSMLVVNGLDKIKKEKTAVERALKLAEAEKLKQQRAWAAAVTAARKNGLPEPAPEEYLHC